MKTMHSVITAAARRTGVALGLLCLVSAPGTARAQFAFTRIDVPDATATYANGNGVQRIVGEFDDADGISIRGRRGAGWVRKSVRG